MIEQTSCDLIWNVCCDYCSFWEDYDGSTLEEVLQRMNGDGWFIAHMKAPHREDWTHMCPGCIADGATAS